MRNFKLNINPYLSVGNSTWNSGSNDLYLQFTDKAIQDGIDSYDTAYDNGEIMVDSNGVPITVNLPEVTATAPAKDVKYGGTTIPKEIITRGTKETQQYKKVIDNLRSGQRTAAKGIFGGLAAAAAIPAAAEAIPLIAKLPTVLSRLKGAATTALTDATMKTYGTVNAANMAKTAGLLGLGEFVLPEQVGNVVNDYTGINNKLGGFGSLLNPGYYVGAGSVRALANGTKKLGLAIASPKNFLDPFLGKGYTRRLKRDWNEIRGTRNIDGSYGWEPSYNFDEYTQNHLEKMRGMFNNGKISINTPEQELLLKNLEGLDDHYFALSAERRMPYVDPSYIGNHSFQFPGYQKEFSLRPLEGNASLEGVRKPFNYKETLLDSIRFPGKHTGVVRGRPHATPDLRKNNPELDEILKSKEFNEGVWNNTHYSPELQEATSDYYNYLKPILGNDGLYGNAGSTLLASRGLLAKAPGDTEFITTRANLEEMKKRIGGIWGNERTSPSGAQVVSTVEGSPKLANSGKAELEILDADKDGYAKGALANEIYAVLHPKEYRALQEARAQKHLTLKDPSTAPYDTTYGGAQNYNFDNYPALPIKANDLLKEYNTGDNALKVQINNYLSSSKGKHIYGFRSMLGDPKLASTLKESIEQKGQTFINDYLPVEKAYPSMRFDDVESNKKLLEAIGMNTDLATNPEVMKTVAEYLHFSTVHSRGNNMYHFRSNPENNNLSLEEFKNSNVGGMTGSGWGGNATNGVAGGGPRYGETVTRFQRLFKEGINTPNDLLKAMKEVDYSATAENSERFKRALEVLKDNNIPTEGMNSIKDISNYIIRMPDLKLRSDLTQQIAEKADMPFSTGKPYGSSRFGSRGTYYAALNRNPDRVGTMIRSGANDIEEKGPGVLEQNISDYYEIEVPPDTRAMLSMFDKQFFDSEKSVYDKLNKIEKGYIDNAHYFYSKYKKHPLYHINKFSKDFYKYRLPIGLTLGSTLGGLGYLYSLGDESKKRAKESTDSKLQKKKEEKEKKKK